MDRTRKIFVASKSDSKVQAVKCLFPHDNVTGFDCPSGVANQPVGNDETFQGATNRLDHLLNKKNLAQADLYVSIESGLAKFGPKTYVDFAVVVIQNANRKRIMATSAGVQALQTDKLIIEEYSKEVLSRQTLDVASHFTGGKCTRTTNLALALSIAYAQLLN